MSLGSDADSLIRNSSDPSIYIPQHTSHFDAPLMEVLVSGYNLQPKDPCELMMDASSPSVSVSTVSVSSAAMFYSFLDRMRNPAALHLVRSIKSFIVSFSFCPPNPENDGKRVQEFYASMEESIINSPLWAGSTEEEIDCALEGLEKYVMTKLFPRTFAASAEDIKFDNELTDKIRLLQNFLKPEHLDIPRALQNEASWLVAVNELQKINLFKAPREKLQCIISCCKVINNLLLDAAISGNHMLRGADSFLPVLIYVTIKANPSQLHSNLRFIQLYRREAKLISEEEYYFTNIASSKTFILELNAKSLSIDELEFEECMLQARSNTNMNQNYSKSNIFEASISNVDRSTVLQDNISGRFKYPYLDADACQLTVRDVEVLLSLYKNVVQRYTSLCDAVSHTILKDRLPLPKKPNLPNSIVNTEELEEQTTEA